MMEDVLLVIIKDFDPDLVKPHALRNYENERFTRQE
jgi:hypothetical protein